MSKAQEFTEKSQEFVNLATKVVADLAGLYDIDPLFINLQVMAREKDSNLFALGMKNLVCSQNFDSASEMDLVTRLLIEQTAKLAARIEEQKGVAEEMIMASLKKRGKSLDRGEIDESQVGIYEVTSDGDFKNVSGNGGPHGPDCKCGKEGAVNEEKNFKSFLGKLTK